MDAEIGSKAGTCTWESAGRRVAFGNKIYYACMGQKEEIIYHETSIDNR